MDTYQEATGLETMNVTMAEAERKMLGLRREEEDSTEQETSPTLQHSYGKP